jgi:hypothetical protein
MTTIENFKKEEITSLMRQFSELKRPISITGPEEKNGIFIFSAKNSFKKDIVSYANKDPYRAKGHFIEKLREKIKKIKKYLPTVDWETRKVA